MGTMWCIPDDVWPEIEALLEERYPRKATGRRRVGFRQVVNAAIYRFRTGCQWNQMPAELGDDSSNHRWFQRFSSDGVFRDLWSVFVHACDELAGVEWDWQSADGWLGKARFGGEATGRNPTDRGKMGTKKSLLVDGSGGPLGIAIAGANIPDSKCLADTLDAIVVERPKGEQNLCLDKGYDNPSGREAVAAAGYVPHIRAIGEDFRKCRRGKKPRRWVVERAFAWLSKCRGLLVRYETRAANYLGLLQLACALLWCRRLMRLKPF